MFCLLLSFAHLLGWRKLMRSSSKLYDFLNVLFHSGQKVSSPKMSLPNQLCFSETRAVTSFVWVIWTVQIVLQNFWPLQTTDESQSLVSSCRTWPSPPGGAVGWFLIALCVTVKVKIRLRLQTFSVKSSALHTLKCSFYPALFQMN